MLLDGKGSDRRSEALEKEESHGAQLVEAFRICSSLSLGRVDDVIYNGTLAARLSPNCTYPNDDARHIVGGKI